MLSNNLQFLMFILLAGLAVGSAVALVAQRNPLYSAISLVGVFIALAGLYVMLAAPFIAAVQVIVYAGAIMVLVIFVIMLLNVEEEEPPRRLWFLLPTAALLAAVLIAEAAFILFFVQSAPAQPADPTAVANASSVGLTSSIGQGLFTTYLLPFEITSILLLMAIVGAMTLARKVGAVKPTDVVVPGAQVLTMQTATGGTALGDGTPVYTDTTAEAARVLGIDQRAT
ncbi:MAG: NADH-quinone oxidoreductase subunit J [Pyrinomonadaceae bacterium]